MGHAGFIKRKVGKALPLQSDLSAWGQFLWGRHQSVVSGTISFATVNWCDLAFVLPLLESNKHTYFYTEQHILENNVIYYCFFLVADLKLICGTAYFNTESYLFSCLHSTEPWNKYSNSFENTASPRFQCQCNPANLHLLNYIQISRVCVVAGYQKASVILTAENREKKIWLGQTVPGGDWAKRAAANQACS